jgi:hypothetical protein
MSYPRFCAHPKDRPSDADLAGTYKVVKLRVDDEFVKTLQQRGSILILKADNTAQFRNFAVFDTPGVSVCRLTGTARWQAGEGLGNLHQWSVEFDDVQPTDESNAPGCSRTLGELQILSRQQSYRLYQLVGDPDSDTGVEYGKE